MAATETRDRRLNLQLAAKHVGVSRRTLYNWQRHGWLDIIAHHGGSFVYESDLLSAKIESEQQRHAPRHDGEPLVRVQMRIEPSSLEQVDQIAKAERLPRERAIRKLIIRGLNAQEQETPMPKTIPIDLTVPNMHMYILTAYALCREELGRIPDLDNPDDTVVADLLIQALEGGTSETMRAWLQASEEWKAKHSADGQGVGDGAGGGDDDDRCDQADRKR